jgi:hypothetical protein
MSFHSGLALPRELRFPVSHRVTPRRDRVQALRMGSHSARFVVTISYALAQAVRARALKGLKCSGSSLAWLRLG